MILDTIATNKSMAGLITIAGMLHDIYTHLYA